MHETHTLAIDEAVLRRARKSASEHDTTVNVLVREALRKIADRVEAGQRGWDELLKLADDAKVEVGPIT